MKLTRSMKVLALSGLASALALALTAARVDAVGTERFVLDDAASLSAGELVRTTVHSDGRVTVGVELVRVAFPEDVALAYTALRAPDGTIFVGTGNDGRVYRLRGETVELHASTGQLLVSSLALGAGGELFAGTVPEGRIYRIAADGTHTEIARPDGVEHVWALAFDAARGVLFAATGPEGRVYAIDRQGRAEIYWDSPASHVMSLALGEEGALYAGTSDDAVVARITGPGRAEIVYDFPGNEITALDFRDGTLAVAANEFAEPPAVTEAHSKTRTANTTSRAPRPRPGKGRIFRVLRDGRTERVYARDSGHVTSVDLLADGVIVGGIGADGHVVRVGPDRATSTYIDVEERQVLRVVMEGDAPFFVTGDGAALYRVASTAPASAIWQSKVLDARFPSRFGQLGWTGQGSLILQTRSGNTERPDETWSAWSADLTQPAPIRSPRARFLQVRARFDADQQAVLRSVTAYFLPQNQRATLTEVRVDGRNKVATDRQRAERQGHVPEASSLYKLAWSVENPDDDRLRFRLAYRREDQTVWREILRESEIITAEEYEWRTEAIPDGLYVVRVEATDALDNPATLALTDQRESEPIRVDNHAPRVEELAFRAGRLTGRAVDALGPIARLELALDGGDWEPIFPVDDLFDTESERFDVDLTARPAGDHVIAVRATDASGNVGSSETQIRIGP